MPKIEVRQVEDATTYWVADRQLSNGDEMLLRLRGNRGWESVTITGLPQDLRVKTTAENGHPIETSIDPSVELRWP